MRKKTHKVTSINVPIEIINFCKDNKINLSEWVTLEFSEKYLNINSKVKRLEEIKREEADLIKDIKKIKERVKNSSMNLTTNEKRFLDMVTPRLRKGASLPAIKNCFNDEFYRVFTLEEFRILVELRESVALDRVKIALSKSRNKR